MKNSDGIHDLSLPINYNKMVTNSANNNLHGNYEDTNGKLEIPLPFGYQLDLDFLRYLSNKKSNGDLIEKYREIKKARRRQRKKLEAILNSQECTKLERKQLISECSNHNLKTISLDLESEQVLSYNEFAGDGLHEAVLDFEDTLEQTIVCGGNMRRRGGTDERSKRCQSLSSLSSCSDNLYQSNCYLDVDGEGLLPDDVDTQSIASISSEMSTHTLKNIREQMASSLGKLKQFEEQVKNLPLLNVKLSLLTEEKRLLMLQLQGNQEELEAANQKQNKPKVEDDRLADDRRESGPPKLSIKTSTKGVSTDKVYFRDKSVNTAVKVKSSHTNTEKVYPQQKLSQTDVKMKEMYSKEELNLEIQNAVFKAEEEMLQCPLLQKAMAAVEQDAKEMIDKDTQVGLYNLNPFVISVGLQTNMPTEEIGTETNDMQDSSSIPLKKPSMVDNWTYPAFSFTDSKREVREVGIVTEKWVEVIKASKQTDTDDIVNVQDESGRISQVVQLKKSMRDVGVMSRPSTRSHGTVTVTRKNSVGKGTQCDIGAEKKKKSRDSQVQSTAPFVDTCLNCEKKRETETSSENSVQPPSPDQPWLSRIPRPVERAKSVENVRSHSSHNLMGRLSFGDGGYARSKSTMSSQVGAPLSFIGSGSPYSLTSRSISPSTPHDSPLVRRSSKSPVKGPSSPLTSRPLPSPTPSTASSYRINAKSPMSSGTRSPSSPRLQKSYSPLKSPSSLGEQKENKSFAMGLKKSFIPKLAQISTPKLKQNSTSSNKKAASNLKPLGDPCFSKKFSNVDSANKSSSDEESLSPDEGSFNPATGEVTPELELPESALFKPIPGQKLEIKEISKDVRTALKVIADSIGKTTRNNAQYSNALNIIQHEWFNASSKKNGNPAQVEYLLDVFEEYSHELLEKIVNLTDVNGNSALHYAVSHANFDTVAVLLDSKVAKVDLQNKAGYTCIMLVSLTNVVKDAHKVIIRRLFSIGDINMKASQHGQTALMLAVSHGRLDIVKLLIEAGADVNICDEDSSTALMCAAEHGYKDIVAYLLSQPDIDVMARDNDGLTALSIAMEANNRDIGVLLYAQMTFSRGTSPYNSLRMKSKANSSGSKPSRIPIGQGHQRSRSSLT